MLRLWRVFKLVSTLHEAEKLRQPAEQALQAILESMHHTGTDTLHVRGDKYHGVLSLRRGPTGTPGGLAADGINGSGGGSGEGGRGSNGRGAAESGHSTSSVPEGAAHSSMV